jgi:hypothetical protein
MKRKTFFLVGPAAAISLANLSSQNIWEEQKVLREDMGEVVGILFIMSFCGELPLK